LTSAPNSSLKHLITVMLPHAAASHTISAENRNPSRCHRRSLVRSSGLDCRYDGRPGHCHPRGLCPRSVRSGISRNYLGALAGWSVGEVGSPEVSQHVVEVVGDITCATLFIPPGHSEWVKGAMDRGSAAEQSEPYI
jgi:hypothetical protein